MIGSISNDNDVCPMFDMLDELSKSEYLSLKTAIQKLLNDSGKAKFTKVFGEVTDLIEDFIAHDKSNTHVRSLVCGYFYINNFLAINTRQLMSLIGKCKSSVNSGFQSIGYKVIPMDAESAVTLMKTFPFMKNQINLTRQWTLRTKGPVPKEESSIATVLSKALNDSSTVTVFSTSFEDKPFQDPSSASSSAYVTPTPEEQKQEQNRSEFQFELDPVEELTGDFEFFDMFTDSNTFESDMMF